MTIRLAEPKTTANQKATLRASRNIASLSMMDESTGELLGFSIGDEAQVTGRQSGQHIDGALAQPVVGEDKARHRFDHGHRPRQDTRIVTSTSGKLGLLV